MKDWKECKLGDVAEIIDCEHKTAPVVERSNFLSIRTTDIKNGKINYENANRVSEQTYIEWTKRKRPQAGDIIFAREAPVGEVGWINEKHRICLGQRTVLLRADNIKIDSRYLLYKLVNNETKFDLINQSSGSVVAHINVRNIRDFNLIMHANMNEQRAIAAILSSLDDKIDLLHRQNKTLEAMAETLFREKFIVNSEKWKIGQVSDLIEFNPMRSLPKGTVAPYLEMANVSTNVFHPEHWYDREFSSGMKFINGDTLLARITPCLENGKSSYVTFLKDGQVGWGSTEFIIMRSKEKLHTLFTYALARNRDFRDYAEGCLEGSSGRQRVNIDHLVKFEINIPSDDVIQNFNSLMKGIEPKLQNNFYQIQTLTKLRDTLLPKLMSGEIRVKSE